MTLPLPEQWLSGSDVVEMLLESRFFLGLSGRWIAIDGHGPSMENPTHGSRFFPSLLTLLLLFAPSGEAQIVAPPTLATFPKSYICVRATTPIIVDGKLDERAWDAAPWTDNFQDIEGDARPSPRYTTRVKMLWDDQNFYIGAELQEPDVWATLTKRDTIIFYDNDFEMFLDPNGDDIEYIEMEMNAFNAVWDLLLPVPYRDGGSGVTGFNIEGLRTAVAVHGTMNDATDRDSGWTVEIAMPWIAFHQYAHRSLPPISGDQWRINFSRVEWQVTRNGRTYSKIAGKPEDNWVWSPQGVIDMHRPERWGFVQFAENRDEKFRPDPSWKARVFLLRLYYAEREFHESHRRWATSFGELGFKTEEHFAAMPILEPFANGYKATVVITLPGGGEQRWHIEQNSHIWPD